MPSCGYWGGVYPDTPEVGDRGGVLGIGSPILAILSQVARGVKGAGGGGDTPTGLPATLSGTTRAIEHPFYLVNTPPQYTPIVKKT